MNVHDKSIIIKDSPNKTRKLCKTCLSNPRFGGSCYCSTCKIVECQRQMLENPYKYKWNECNPLGMTYFVNNLKRLYLFCVNKPHVLKNLFGEQVVSDYYKHFNQLMRFADQEYKYYGFSPICFSHVRLEKDIDTITLDFWLTLCCCYDISNYITDISYIHQ